MTSCLIIQHAEPERPYAIEATLRSAGVEIALRTTFSDPVGLPKSLEGTAGLVVMGGPMSAASDEGFATRGAELALLGDALERRVPTLGICLGAQLLASAGGGKVLAGPAGPEVGWAPIELCSGDDPLLAGLPEQLTVLHWHGDTYARPPGGVLLASSARYEEQAFRLGPAAWGFQFHIEVDRFAVGAFIDAFGEEALAAGSSPEAIAAGTSAALQGLEPHRARVLERFAGLVVAYDTAIGESRPAGRG
ncbi:MAG: type 1 glutamine amidotransferase [Acidimicrobiales bacterium]